MMMIMIMIMMILMWKITAYVSIIDEWWFG